MTADLSTAPPRSYRFKRTFDLAVVALTAPISVPLIVALAVVVRFALGRPIFFRQRRPGLDQREFVLLKFRTMTDVRNTDGSLRPDAERLTRFGRFLRSTSLDELPELMNVLRGDMSLVGPRPLLSRYLPYYSAEHQLRHTIRPGITGLAQVSGRNLLSWPERFDLDVEYVRTNSLRLDLSILSRTFVSVLSREGISARDEVTMGAFTGYDEVPEIVADGDPTHTK